MTADQLWKQFVEKYPKWADGDHHVTLTARGLRKMVETAFDQGVIHHDQVQARVRELTEKIKGVQKQREENFFESIFGK